MTNAGEFYGARNDRTLRYAGRVLDPERSLAITVSPGYLESVAGQAATVVAANLLARMSPNVVLAFGDVSLGLPIKSPLGGTLHGYVLAQMRGSDPYGSFVARTYQLGDYRIHLGGDEASWVAHGSDWNAFVGPSPSPLPSPKTANIFGAAFASIIAVAKIFAEFLPAEMGETKANLVSWNTEIGDSVPIIRAGEFIGDIWFVGGGSVGSAVAYFLTLAGLKFDATIFDRDVVKIENLDRSPIFQFSDTGKPKTEAVVRFLEENGLKAESEPVWLEDSEVWKRRQQGTPDILVSAANERNVRYAIETQFPPLQVYGTTGQNWQASVLRHIPPQDPCSCCIFPPTTLATTRCATGRVTWTDSTGQTKQIDAAVPFLSFAAGLMAAAEIAKLTMPNQPENQRAFFTPCAEEVVFARHMGFREGCVCRDRNRTIHRAMISGSNYANLSKF